MFETRTRDVYFDAVYEYSHMTYVKYKLKELQEKNYSLYGHVNSTVLG